jgi:hypothetical protein
MGTSIQHSLASTLLALGVSLLPAAANCLYYHHICGSVIWERPRQSKHLSRSDKFHEFQ